MSTDEFDQSIDRLNYLRRRWSEIQPSEDLRGHAERQLGVHKLRAADALQLATALVWANHLPRGRHFIGADRGLLASAKVEGFSVIAVL